MGDVLAALAYAGAGAGIGTIGAAVITSRGQKGESRAHAADLIANAAGELADRVTKLNEHLEVQNQDLHEAIGAAEAHARAAEEKSLAQRRAIILLTDVIDEILGDLELSPAKHAQLAEATKAARLAL
jgi:hypothetical protein